LINLKQNLKKGIMSLSRIATLVIFFSICISLTAQNKDRNGVNRTNKFSKANYKPYSGDDPMKLAEMQAKKIKSVLKLNKDQGDFVNQIFDESAKLLIEIENKEYKNQEDKILAIDRVKSSRNASVKKILKPEQAMKFERIVEMMGEKQIATVEFKTRQKIQYLDKNVGLNADQKDMAYQIFYKYQEKINDLKRKDIADAPQNKEAIQKLSMQQDEEIYEILTAEQLEKIADKVDSPLESSNSLYGKQMSKKLNKLLDLAPQQQKIIKNITSRNLGEINKLRMAETSPKKLKKASKKIAKTCMKSIGQTLNNDQSKLFKASKKDIKKEFIKIALR